MASSDNNKFNPSEGGEISVDDTVTTKDWEDFSQSLVLINSGQNNIYIQLGVKDVDTTDFYLEPNEDLEINRTVHRLTITCDTGQTSTLRYFRS